VSRRPGTADDRDVYRPKTPPAGVVAQNWDEQPSSVHTEPWLFRALKDLKEHITGVGERQQEQGEAIAEIRGKVDTLASFVPRPKSPSSSDGKVALAEHVLADRRETKRFWHTVGAKVAGGFFSGGVLVAIAKHFGWL